MTSYLNGLVTFGTNGERNRAANAVQSWVANYNATHPAAAFIGQVANTTYQYDIDDEAHPGVAARALSIVYSCTEYAGIQAAQQAIAQDVNANAYWDIVSMGIWTT
jgi:hypothetical protein